MSMFNFKSKNESFSDKNIKNIKNINLNFGPQHPAAHGVLRLVLTLNNEKVVKCDPHIGLLHRGSEYLITTKPYYLSLPYFDRMDYVSILLQEHGYCLAIENGAKVKNNNFLINLNRGFLDEITRIFNHLLAIACHALDVGSMSPIFWLFEEREVIMEFFEDISGARMHSNIFRPISGNKVLKKNKVKIILFFLNNLFTTVTEVISILNNSKVWRTRTVGNGILTKKQVESWGITGPMSRASGYKMDLRVNKPYSSYKFETISSFVGKNGDSFTRYLIRAYEIIESSSYLIKLSKKIITLDNYFFFKKNNFFMEKTISHFNFWEKGFSIPKGFSIGEVESSKGLFTVSVFFLKNNIPFKCKIRAPSYNHLAWIKEASVGYSLSDLVTLIGTVDIVFGEIDR